MPLPLERRAESLEGWLSFWIVLVVIGLLVEIYEVLQHHLADPKRPQERSNWTLFQALIGPVLIAIGVVGELGIHFTAGSVNTALRNANREVVALLNKEAGLARQDAESARRDAGSFSVRISEANARAEAGKKDAAGALERAANAELRAAATNATAEKLRNNNLVLQADVLKLRERLAGRRITPAQHDQFVAALRPYRGSL